MKRLGKILAGIGIVLVIVFAGGIGKFVGKSTTERFFDGKKEGSIDAVLVEAASRINENLPMMVDAETRLDATVGVIGRFRYNYTLVNFSAEELDPGVLKDTMQPKLVNNVCTSTEMEIFVQNDVPVTYAYFGKNGKQVTTITISPNQCTGS